MSSDRPELHTAPRQLGSTASERQKAFLQTVPGGTILKWPQQNTGKAKIFAMKVTEEEESGNICFER